MGTINETVKQKIAGKPPGELVTLQLHLKELCLLDDDCEVLLEKLNAVIGIQTAHTAAVTVPVEHVEAVAALPSVLEVHEVR